MIPGTVWLGDLLVTSSTHHGRERLIQANPRRRSRRLSRHRPPMQRPTHLSSLRRRPSRRCGAPRQASLTRGFWTAEAFPCAALVPLPGAPMAALQTSAPTAEVLPSLDAMSRFHVRLSVAGETSDETKIDLTEEQLEQQFLAPYREGRPITVNGRVIELANLERIRISTSEHSARDFIPQLQEEDRSSSVVVFGGPSYSWRAADRAKDVTDRLISGPPGRPADQSPGGDAQDPKLRRVSVPAGPGDGRSVFLAYGRNLQVRDAMTQFLRSLDLKVIEWEQALAMTGEPNPYIGDVLAAGLEAADGVVILATPDDIVRLDPSLGDDGDPELSEKKQPRQNVIYEAGMAMALAPTRTLVVATTGTRILSDIAGRHLAYLSDSAQARKRLIGRLQTMGLRVDDSGEDWLEAGDFGS